MRYGNLLLRLCSCNVAADALTPPYLLTFCRDSTHCSFPTYPLTEKPSSFLMIRTTDCLEGEGGSMEGVVWSL